VIKTNLQRHMGFSAFVLNVLGGKRPLPPAASVACAALCYYAGLGLRCPNVQCLHTCPPAFLPACDCLPVPTLQSDAPPHLPPLLV
jgi:hypothetical protein